MFGYKPETVGKNVGTEPIYLGLTLSVPISSEVGSASLLFAQPLINGRVFASTVVLIASEIIIFIARQFFDLKSLPIIDASNGQTVQMPITELQEFLRWMANRSGPSPNSITNGRSIITNTDGQSRSFVPSIITPTTPETPLVVSIVISADYSTRPFTPSLAFFVPILTFPGVRGALPILILGLLATIFVRAVVPPESTGSKPLVKPGATNDEIDPLTFSPNDLLQLLTKFGKHFSPK